MLSARAVDRQRNGQVCGYIAQSHSTGNIHIDIIIEKWDLYRTLEHCGNTGDAADVNPIGDNPGVCSLSGND